MRHFIAVLLCAVHITASAINTADTIVKDNKPTPHTDLHTPYTFLLHEREQGAWGSSLHTHNARLAQMVTKLVAEKNKALFAQAGS
jgi:hypothetical protein